MPVAAQGKRKERKPNIITSLELDPAKMEENNLRFQAKYRQIEANEVRYEEYMCEDADYLLVAFGSSARICQKVVENARAEGIKDRLAASHHIVAIPNKGHRGLCGQSQRYAFGRIECGTNGRRHPVGQSTARLKLNTSADSVVSSSPLTRYWTLPSG